MIPSLDIDGQQLRSTEEILKGLSNHYEKLFKKQDNFSETELARYLNKIECPKLTKNESELLERDITVEELGETLKKLQNNRSPGSDGFPYEFYKVFWGEIKYFVHKSLIFGLAKGSLSVSQRDGIITLVPKPSKPRNLTHLRPSLRFRNASKSRRDRRSGTAQLYHVTKTICYLFGIVVRVILRRFKP